MKQLDEAFFRYTTNKLKDATPDQICQHYVENLIFHNGDYLQYLQKEYKLPDDMLKMHAKIVKLAG